MAMRLKRTNPLWALALVAALGVGVSACSDSDSTPMAKKPAPMDDDGMMDGDGATTPLGSAGALNDSVDALNTLAAGADEEGSALAMAAEYAGKFGVLANEGDSTSAQMNAQGVLNARKALADAIEDAKAKKMAAEEAKAALPEDAESALVDALDDAIEDAETAIEDAQERLDATGTGTLASYVEMVTGGEDADPQGTPTSVGKKVADAILVALEMDTGSAQLPSAGADFSAVPTATSPTVGKVVAGPSDAQGMTWAQIGGSGLMDKRIAATATTSTVVKAKSVAGMTAGDLFATAADDDTFPTVTRTTVTTGDGDQHTTSVFYKGIAGTLFCAGEDCKVEGEGTDLVAGDKLTGSWYFAPTNADATYLAGMGDAAGTYSVEEPADYVRYGYWLVTDNADPEVITINRYADGPDAQTAAVYGLNTSGDAFRDASAVYTGDAVGMSVVQHFDTKGKELSRASGHFDADVRLTMQFGAAPRLGGMIYNFRGSAVDRSWSVDLDSAALASGAVTAGETDGGGDPGAWTATAWGGSDTAGEEARPTGVYGAFDADFTNGAAAGVFNTRK